MPLADSYSYPVLGAFWTIFELFLFVVWIWLLFWIFADIFRSRDMSGWAKAAWTIFVLVIPVIGILCYLIVRGGSMHERAARDARAQDDAARAYIRDAAGRESPAEQLSKLATLRDQGVINDSEFEREKAKVLAGAPASAPPQRTP
jgi:type VI protein secretion system component VasK